MPARLRKLIGAILLLVLVAVWALLGMAFAQFLFSATDSVLAWVYYAVAGIGWVLPAMPIVKWMAK